MLPVPSMMKATSIGRQFRGCAETGAAVVAATGTTSAIVSTAAINSFRVTRSERLQPAMRLLLHTSTHSPISRMKK